MRHGLLEKLGACEDAQKWAEQFDTLPDAWRACPRADWMLWLLGKMTGTPGWPSHQTVVRLACACARRALRYVPEGEERPRLAIEAAEAWAVNPTPQNARAARDAARDAWAAAGAAWVAAGAAGVAEMAEMAAMIRETVPEIPGEEG